MKVLKFLIQIKCADGTRWQHGADGTRWIHDKKRLIAELTAAADHICGDLTRGPMPEVTITEEERPE